MVRSPAARAAGEGAPACPCRRPRTSSTHRARGRKRACRSFPLPSAPRPPRPPAPAACGRARPRSTPRRSRCCFSRAMGSPSGKCFQSSAGRYLDGSSEVEWAPGPVGDPFDEGRPEPAPRALGGPAGRREHREEVVAVHAQRRDAVADAARGEGGGLAARDALERRDRPLVVDDVEDDRRPIDGGEGERVVEIGLRGRAVADPRRGDARVALDRRRHRPAHGLDVLRAEIAGDGEEAVPARRVHDRQLPALDRVALVREQLAHHVHEAVAARDQDPLLAIGREAHVVRFERQRLADADRFLAQALHVERQLLLPLGDQHAGVEDAGPQHRAQAGRAAVRGPPADPRDRARASSSRTRTSAPATSPVSDGRVSTAGRRTAPAGDSCRYEKSVSRPGRPVGSGTCRRSGGYGLIRGLSGVVFRLLFRPAQGRSVRRGWFGPRPVPGSAPRGA